MIPVTEVSTIIPAISICLQKTIHHLAIQMPKKQATRFLGIQSTCTGSSEEAVKEWERALKHISDLYNESPFGKRQGSLLKFIDFMIKLTGINTDHCAKEKKTARLLETLKTWAVDQSLGEDTMLEM